MKIRIPTLNLFIWDIIEHMRQDEEVRIEKIQIEQQHSSQAILLLILDNFSFSKIF